MTQRSLPSSYILLCISSVVVLSLGAYTRLSHSGLGCPDWPGCYGHWRPFGQFASSSDHWKAWIEMIHRYAAGILGCGIIASILHTSPRTKPLNIWLIVILSTQVLLGMLTVTVQLNPLIVSAHFFGGTSIACLLWKKHLCTQKPRYPSSHPHTPYIINGTIALVIIQMALGCWTSTNYAALICPDFPTCQGQWWPRMAFTEAFFNLTFLQNTLFEGGILSGKARTAIHISHRIGALIASTAILRLCIHLWQQCRLYRLSLLLGLLCTSQLLLGIINATWQLPMSSAMGHHFGAIVITLTLLWLHHHTQRI